MEDRSRARKPDSDRDPDAGPSFSEPGAGAGGLSESGEGPARDPRLAPSSESARQQRGTVMTQTDHGGGARAERAAQRATSACGPGRGGGCAAKRRAPRKMWGPARKPG